MELLKKEASGLFIIPHLLRAGHYVNHGVGNEVGVVFSLLEKSFSSWKRLPVPFGRGRHHKRTADDDDEGSK